MELIMRIFRKMTGDIKNYQIHVHALKSTAKIIGADDLFYKAFFHRKAFFFCHVTQRETQETSFILGFKDYLIFSMLS